MKLKPYRPLRLLLLPLCLILLLASGTGAGAQGGEGFSLEWYATTGGGGTSTGGQFTLQGTAGQQQSEPAQGGDFGLTSGYEQPQCPSGGAEGVIVAIALAGTDVTLSWQPNAANGAYEVYRSSQPYASPSRKGLLATLFAPAAGYGDAGAAGHPETNLFYVVRATCGPLWSDSNRTGEFSFDLVR